MADDNAWFDESDDAWSEQEFSGEDDRGDETIPCAECGAEIYEDSVQCPHCGVYITDQSTTNLWTDRPVWWILLGLLGLVATILALAGVAAW